MHAARGTQPRMFRWVLMKTQTGESPEGGRRLKTKRGKMIKGGPAEEVKTKVKETRRNADEKNQEKR